MIPWFFMSEAFITTANCIVEKSYLVKKVVFNITLLPIVKIVSLLFVHLFFVALLVLLAFVLYLLSKSLSNDLLAVSNGFSQICANEQNITSNLPIVSNDEIGDLVSYFNKIQKQQKDYLDQLHNNQDMLMEKERLASLGQLIGGISHNLKTPIMSISGAAEGLTDLINEYDTSIGDPEVTPEDHHAIANDMRE